MENGDVDASDFQFKNLAQAVYVVFDQVVLGRVRNCGSLSCFVCVMSKALLGCPKSGVIERSHSFVRSSTHQGYSIAQRACIITVSNQILRIKELPAVESWEG